MKKRAPVTLVRIGMRAIACIVAFAACPEGVVGSIPPSQFHFKNVVPTNSKGQPDGWKAAQVIITLGDRYGVAICRIEIGVPEQNLRGVVADLAAQQAAAEAADRAARVALGLGPAMSAARCQRFKEEMQRFLRDVIPGARVSAFITDGLEATTWP